MRDEHGDFGYSASVCSTQSTIPAQEWAKYQTRDFNEEVTGLVYGDVKIGDTVEILRRSDTADEETLGFCNGEFGVRIQNPRSHNRIKIWPCWKAIEVTGEVVEIYGKYWWPGKDQGNYKRR